MINFSCKYQRLSVQLILEGLSYNRKKSTLQNPNIDILTKWSLTIGNQPRLEGRIDQLLDLFTSLNIYASRIMDNVPNPSKANKTLASIMSQAKNHKIILYSSYASENIHLQLDDAEFIDLVLCMDTLFIDQRIGSRLELPSNISFKKNYKIKKFFHLFTAPLFSMVMITGGIYLGLTQPFEKMYNVNQEDIKSNVSFQL
uniref:Uncharacterized protein n=1 Tax=Paulinella longichromatophora TaxID=1708747 RepID=A0A2H4ZQA8_9EUKA|nr:hypothetical protein PLO_737 [Paulinella longichromatophora]